MAEKLNRKWIGCDLSEYSIYLSRKRLNKLRKNETQGFFEIYTHLDEKKKKIISSGFFEKDLKISRK